MKAAVPRKQNGQIGLVEPKSQKGDVHRQRQWDRVQSVLFSLELRHLLFAHFLACPALASSRSKSAVSSANGAWATALFG